MCFNARNQFPTSKKPVAALKSYIFTKTLYIVNTFLQTKMALGRPFFARIPQIGPSLMQEVSENIYV